MERTSCHTSIHRASLFLGLILACAPVFSAEITGKGFPLRAAPANAVPYQTVPAQQTVAAPAPTPAVAATPAAPASFENSPLAFAGSDRRRAEADGGKGYSMPSIWPALLAVMGVCGLFVVGLVFMKKYLPGHRQLFNHPAMELLGRTHLDQRRFVTLLRVGRRLVVVGVCAEEMRTLAEITDEGEVTEIMEVARPKTEVGLTIFQKLFQRNVIENEAAETRAMAREKVAELDAQMSSLRERVKEMRDEETPREEKPLRRQLDAVG